MGDDRTTASSASATRGGAEMEPRADATLEMGWGKLVFGQTFRTNEGIVAALRDEEPGHRNIAMYLTDPHVLLSMAPLELFLDPSHTFRLRIERYEPAAEDRTRSFVVRPSRDRADLREINRIYSARGMVQLDEEHEHLDPADTAYARFHLVAEAKADGAILGVITAVDHVRAFGDPEGGSSFWSLAVDPQAPQPGIGEALVRGVVEHMALLGRRFVDLSVMHDNEGAIRLYDKLGFERVPYFTCKRKNPHNEPLFTAPPGDVALNPYAQLIVDEARRRGIGVEVLSEDPAVFTLEVGGRSVRCHESLTDLTTAVSLLICDHKRLAHRVLKDAGLRVPDQRVAGREDADLAFLEQHGRVVVKPARG